MQTVSRYRSSLGSRLPFQKARPQSSSRVPTIWQHTCLPRGSCQILRLKRTTELQTTKNSPLRYLTRSKMGRKPRPSTEFCQPQFLSNWPCHSSHLCGAHHHLFHMEIHPTRADCPLPFCSFCSCVVVMLESSSGTSGC